MSKVLSRLLRREQFAFLARDRAAWGGHLDRVRTFLGEGLRQADPARPTLILGAGSGLEIPWAQAPRGSTGWDADPWSRVWTALRHRRWAPWVFEDLTGGLGILEDTAKRAVAEPWSGRQRSREQAALRLAGLLPSLNPEPRILRDWVAGQRPGTILAANVLGQLGVVAERLVEGVLGGPWSEDAERDDPLSQALEAWTRRALEAVVAVLAESGAGLWLVHDRAVIYRPAVVTLGPWTRDWTGQVEASGSLEASDPLAGLDLVDVLEASGRPPRRAERWLWPVGPGQLHLVEALTVPGVG